jgi:methylated-DNA-[protein]-cysteine S-methyltransferase
MSAVAAFDVVMRLPVAGVGICIRGDAVTDICFLPRGAEEVAPAHTLAARVYDAIRTYLDDPALQFDLPLAVEGSEFQREVWAAIARIRSGETRTYGELAAELGSTARAVGQACGDNRLPIVIPCHRVVSARGMGGFAHRTDGFMLDVKRWLLAHESRACFSLVP